MKKILASTFFAAVFLYVAVSSVSAAPGDAVQPPIVTPSGCTGIGVAYDGSDVLYTCAFEDGIRKTDLTGADNGFVATVDTLGAPLSVDAIAWDSNENMLW